MWGVTLWEKVFVKNERTHQSCVRSAILYGSDTWCPRENEIAILRRTEKATMRAMCVVKMIEKRRSQKLMGLLGCGVRWYGHVLRKDNGEVLRRELDFKVAERGRGRPEYDVEEHSDQIALKKEDCIDRAKWCNAL